MKLGTKAYPVVFMTEQEESALWSTPSDQMFVCGKRVLHWDTNDGNNCLHLEGDKQYTQIVRDTEEERLQRERAGLVGKHAKEKFEVEGDLEFDLPLCPEDLSEGDDNGAYVRCWKWVPFEGTPWDKNK